MNENVLNCKERKKKTDIERKLCIENENERNKIETVTKTKIKMKRNLQHDCFGLCFIYLHSNFP